MIINTKEIGLPDQFLKVVKEKCLKMLHDNNSSVWVVNALWLTTCIITEREEVEGF